MRFYKDFGEALNEIKRDLAELSIRVHPQTMQDKYIADDPDYDTKELQNYIYTVLNPRPKDLKPTQPWATREWMERISQQCLNPGKAWKARADVWEEFVESSGEFAYTYSERLGKNIDKLVTELRIHPESRQLFLGIWDKSIDVRNLGGEHRIPCTLGYWFLLRQHRLDMTYLQRSSDYVTHLQNDLWLATKMLLFVAEQGEVNPGHLIHWVGSLHVYAKDVKGVF